MAHCTLFLASRASSYVTGAILVADGGAWLTSANDVSMLLGIASSKSAKLWTGALLSSSWPRCVGGGAAWGPCKAENEVIVLWIVSYYCLNDKNSETHVNPLVSHVFFQAIGHLKRGETSKCWKQKSNYRPSSVLICYMYIVCGLSHHCCLKSGLLSGCRRWTLTYNTYYITCVSCGSTYVTIQGFFTHYSAAYYHAFHVQSCLSPHSIWFFSTSHLLIKLL